MSEGAERNVWSLGAPPFRELELVDPEATEAMVNLFRNLECGLIRNVIEQNWDSSGWYIQQVIVFSDDRERDVLLRYLREQGEKFPRDFFGYSAESNHIHVVHSCSFSSNQCKCRWRKNLPCGKLKPGYRGRRLLRQFDRYDWIDAILYFFYEKGGHKQAWVKGNSTELENNCK